MEKILKEGDEAIEFLVEKLRDCYIKAKIRKAGKGWILDLILTDGRVIKLKVTRAFYVEVI